MFNPQRTLEEVEFYLNSNQVEVTQELIRDPIRDSLAILKLPILSKLNLQDPILLPKPC